MDNHFSDNLSHAEAQKKKTLIKVYFAKHKWLDVNEINRGLHEHVIKSNCTLKSNSNKFITNWKKTPKL